MSKNKRLDDLENAVGGRGDGPMTWEEFVKSGMLSEYLEWASKRPDGEDHLAFLAEHAEQNGRRPSWDEFKRVTE